MVSTTRKLAAIMFTDIVGYTSLMGSDEDHAFEVLRKNREIHKKFIDQFNGTLIKEMGDGMLAQFDSAADSVGCAIEIQKQASKELEAKVRVGIHLGDITLENNDVFGDGVNIASRLQSITDPGGIYISESVFNAIRSRKDIKSQYLGEVKLKNVNYPLKVYYINEEGLPLPSRKRIDELTGSEKNKSVVVLPFDNYTGDEQLDYFVAGMHASLIGSISKVGEMRVISKTTANAFKNTEKSIPEIATELEVDTVIEASVFGLGEEVGLQVKLLDVYPKEKQLWMQDYQVEKSQILNLYSAVTKEITNEINVHLTPEERRLLSKTRTIDKHAYEEYMKAQQYIGMYSKEALDNAQQHIDNALSKEPDWAPLYVSLADVWIGRQQMGFEPPSVASPKIYENLNKALELDPDLPEAHNRSGLIAHVMEWDWKKSERKFLKALAIDPNDANSRVLYAQLLCVLQRTEEGLAQGRLALDLDPLNTLVKCWYAGVFMFAGDFNTGLEYVEEVLTVDPQSYLAHAGIQIAAYPCKDYHRLIYAEQYFLRMYQVGDKDVQEIDRIFKEDGLLKAYEKIIQHLQQLSENYPISPFDMAMRCIIGEQHEKALDWLEKGYELHDPAMTYIATMETFAPLFDHPRFLSIVEKMNLPMPKK
jgi:adenylate cyclase